MSELRYEVRGCSEDILLDKNDEYITAQDRISELEEQVAELKCALTEAMEWNWLDDDAPDKFDVDNPY